MTEEKLFQSVAEALETLPGVTRSKMFGSVGLKAEGKVFAMPFKGKLVVKLPKERVKALIQSSEGEHFDPGHGRLMKEWVAMKVSTGPQWLEIAEEARHFVLPAK